MEEKLYNARIVRFLTSREWKVGAKDLEEALQKLEIICKKNTEDGIREENQKRMAPMLKTTEPKYTWEVESLKEDSMILDDGIDKYKIRLEKITN